MSATATPRYTEGNVIWRHDGSVVAVWQAPQNTHRHGPVEKRSDGLDLWERVLGKIPARWTHHTFDAQVSSDDIVRRMADAVGGIANLPNYPAYQRRVTDTIEYLSTEVIERDGEPNKGLPHERHSYLYVDMPTGNLGRGASRLQETLHNLIGTEVNPPKDDEVADAVKWADAIGRELQAIHDGFAPATVEELIWLYEHAETAGAGNEEGYPHPELHDDALIGNAVLIPFPAPPHAKPGSLIFTTPTVDSDGRRTTQEAHRATLVAEKLPRAWLYPHGCLRDLLDELPWPVMTTLVGQAPMSAVALRNALAKTARANRETEKESAADASQHTDLDNSREDHAYLEPIAESKNRTYPTSILITVVAETAEMLEQRIVAVEAALSETGAKTRRPTLTRLGDQLPLYHALLPGGVVPPIVDTYARPGLTARDVAMIGNHHGWQFGDNRGRVYGYRSDTNGLLRLVFRDPTKGPLEKDGGTSATSGHLGTPGAGKTTELKEDATQTREMEGCVFAYDRSPEREMARVASLWHGRVSIITPTGDTVADPLRILLGADTFRDSAEDYKLAISLISSWLPLYLGITGAGEDYDTVLSALYALTDEKATLTPSLPNLYRVLRMRAGIDTDYTPDENLYAAPTDHAKHLANTLATRLVSHAKANGRYETLFGDGKLPDFDVDAIIYCSDTEIPDRETLAGFGTNLPPQIIAAQAEVFYVTAMGLAYAKHQRQRRFTLLVLPEVGDLAASPYGTSMLDNTVRKLRRQLGGAATDSQLAAHYAALPRDAGDMIRYRTAGRTENKNGARSALEWLDIEPTDALIRKLMTAPAGRKIARDPHLNVAWIDLFQSPNYEMWLMARTDPDANKDRAAYFSTHHVLEAEQDEERRLDRDYTAAVPL